MSVFGILDTTASERVDELILSQYKDSPNLINYIKSFVSPIQSIKTADVNAIGSRNLFQATGYSLDKIGKVVGENRLVRGANGLGFFGFDDFPSALGLSEGLFYSYGDKTTSDLIMADPMFRNAIRARIIKNTAGGKIENIIHFCQLITGLPLNIEITEGTASVAIRFHESLSPSSKVILAVRIKEIISIGVSVTLEDDNGVIEVVDL